MIQDTYQTPLAGGVATRLPQNPQDANVCQNLIVDKSTGGWSTRIGYERFKLGGSSWSPFASCGPIYSLHAAQNLATGARQSILFEEKGNLHLLYDSSGLVQLKTIRTGRSIPTATETGSWFTDTPYGTVVTNGQDRPLLVYPWPSPKSSSVLPETFARPFGFDGLPAPVDPYKVVPMPRAGSGVIYDPQAGGGAVTIWCPSDTAAIPSGGQWGLGLANNLNGTDRDKSSIFGWSVAFISDTGSEGPSSVLSSATWSISGETSANAADGAQGFRHACLLDIPVGPDGTVARKLYRTTNYSDDYVSQGDTTLYFLDLVRNNVEDQFFDAIATAALGQPAPDIATGPLPAPAARFSALYSGCLFLDGGIEDGRTLYYSAAGLIEQFDAASYIELSSQGGMITALFAHYTDLLVFRENGIDVVRGSYASGFTVTTLSNSVTCRAPQSIEAIPGLGVVFLGQDGVYALTGGLEGGAVSDVVNLTVAQDDLIQRITPDCHPKAVATFSAELREYQLYLPADGSDRPSLGLVFHIDRLGQADQLSPWSTRLGFPVGSVATLYDGTVIFGHNVGDEAGGTDSQRGLFVISSKRALGASVVADVMTDGPPPTSIYRSAWWSGGDPQVQKQVSYVTVWILTTGGPEVTLRHYKDFRLTPVSERTYVCQPPDATPLPELDSVVLGANTYQTERLVPLRFSVAHMSASWFCFELETTEDIVLVGYEYTYTTKGTLIVQGPRA